MVKYLLIAGFLSVMASIYFCGCLAEPISHFVKCIPGDTDCVKTLMNNVLRNQTDGYPELELPVLDPFHANEIAFSHSITNTIKADLNMTNLNIFGFSESEVKKVVGFERDPEKSKFEITTLIPKLRINGNYKIKGKLHTVPIRGEGEVETILENVEIAHKFKPSVVIKDDKKYLQIEKQKLLVIIGNLHVNFTNSLEDQYALTRDMQGFINANWKIFWERMRPTITASLGQIVKSFLNPLFKKVAYDDFFVQDE